MTGTSRDARAFQSLVSEVQACLVCDRVAHSHVLGDVNGQLDASVLFVAEAVGRRGGAVTGVPLTRDESGRRFGEFLRVAGIERSDTFVTNAVLCNPLNDTGCNRAPSTREIARCRPFLARTLEIVRTPVVVALGRVALESLRAIAPHDAQIPKDVGSPVPCHDRTLVPMYHPSRQSTLHRRQAEQEDDWRRLGMLIRERRLATSEEPLLRPAVLLYHDDAG